MISVAEKPRPSHRAKIGVNTPGINRHKHVKTVKKEFNVKTKKQQKKMLEYFEQTRRLAQKYKIMKNSRRVCSKYSSIFLLFFCFYVEFFFYRLDVFMPGVLTPIFAR